MRTTLMIGTLGMMVALGSPAFARSQNDAPYRRVGSGGTRRIVTKAPAQDGLTDQQLGRGAVGLVIGGTAGAAGGGFVGAVKGFVKGAVRGTWNGVKATFDIRPWKTVNVKKPVTLEDGTTSEQVVAVKRFKIPTAAKTAFFVGLPAWLILGGDASHLPIVGNHIQQLGEAVNGVSPGLGKAAAFVATTAVVRTTLGATWHSFWGLIGGSIKGAVTGGILGGAFGGLLGAASADGKTATAEKPASENAAK